MRTAGKRLQTLYPGPPPEFLRGSIPLLQKMMKQNNFPTMIQALDSLFHTYGDTYRAFLGPFPFLYTRDVELIKFVSTNDPEHFIKFQIDVPAKDVVGQSLLFTEGKEWYRKRSLMRNAFKKNALESFLSKFHESAQELGAYWKKQSEEKKEIDVVNNFSRFTMDVIGRVGFGTDLQCINKPGSSSVVKDWNILLEMEHNFGLNPLGLLLGSKFWKTVTPSGRNYVAARDRLLGVVNQVLQDRERQSGSQEKKKNDLLQYLIESSGEHHDLEEVVGGKKNEISEKISQQNDNDEKKTIKKYSNEELIQEVMLFFLAGHETTSNALSWTIYHLANNPEIRQRVLDELTEQGFSSTNSNPPTWSQLNNLPYLNQVLKETLRLHPATSGYTRQTSHDLEYKGKIIPANTPVSCQIWSVHRDPRHYGEGDLNLFNPDRFTPENIKNRHAYAWIPFAAGARNCIGMQFALMEARVALAYLLPRFEFTTTSEPIMHARAIVLTSKNMRMRVQPK